MKEVHDYIYKVILGRVPKKKTFKIRKDGKYSLVLEEKSGLITSLNSTASMVLEYCDGKNTIKDIVDKIWSRYTTVDKKVIMKDVIECTRHLESMQLISVYS